VSRIRAVVKALTNVEEPFTNLTIPHLGGRTRSGVNVTRDRALRQGAVWACIRNRAEDVAKLPVRPIEYQGNTRIRRDPPPWLQRPNPETTTFELFERTMASMDADGNGFWHYTKDRLGRVAEVWVLPPADVQVFREDPKPGQTRINPKRFRYGNEEFGLDQIVHFTGFTLPGRLRGLNPVQQHMHAIGLAVAAEEFGESFFGNGAVMSGVVSLPPGADLTPEKVQEMQDGIARDHRGLANAHRPGVLFGGATWTPLTIPNDAAQFLETRKYQTADIARIWRMPLHKIGDLERATFSNIEQQSIDYVGDAIHPPVARIEATVRAAGLLPMGQHLKFNLAALLRGDTEARYRAYALGIQWGWLCPDDVRELEDLNPLPDGQGSTYLRPLNMIPAGWALPPEGAAPLPGGGTQQTPTEVPA
jgi:HK97 family phage portal protein